MHPQSRRRGDGAQVPCRRPWLPLAVIHILPVAIAYVIVVVCPQSISGGVAGQAALAIGAMIVHRVLSADMALRCVTYRKAAIAVVGGVLYAWGVELMCNEQRVAVRLLSDMAGVDWVCMFAINAAWAASEEFFFRGSAWSASANYVGPWWATLMGSLSFALFHFPASFTDAMVITGAAVLLCLLRIASGSIAPCIMWHFSYNAFVEWPSV